jgi:hypothetical protein
MDTAITERRMLAVERESMEALYDIDRDKVEALLAARPKGSFSEKGSGGPMALTTRSENRRAQSTVASWSSTRRPRRSRSSRQALKDDGSSTRTPSSYRDAAREIVPQARASANHCTNPSL